MKGMSGPEPPGDPSSPKSERFLSAVKTRADRRELEAGYRDRGFWTGVGVMGLVGWSVILPAVLGAYLGILLDRQLSLHRIFSGIFVVVGLCLGCWNAWRMVHKVLKPHHEEEGASRGGDEG